MPHAIEMKDGKILTPFGIQDLLEAVSDYAGEELAREIESYIDTTVRLSPVRWVSAQRTPQKPSASWQTAVSRHHRQVLRCDPS